MRHCLCLALALSVSCAASPEVAHEASTPPRAAAPRASGEAEPPLVSGEASPLASDLGPASSEGLEDDELDARLAQALAQAHPPRGRAPREPGERSLPAAKAGGAAPRPGAPRVAEAEDRRGSVPDSAQPPPAPLTPLPPWDDTPDVVEGRVIAIVDRASPVWVLISLGSSSGIDLGVVYEVQREGRFVAELVADQVAAHQTACRVVVAADAPWIRVGDRVVPRQALRPPTSQREWPAIRVPKIDTRVFALREDPSEPTLLLLEAGLEQGVEAGFHFSVYRRDRFVAKVVVEQVSRDLAGCRVLFTADGQELQVGDAATTRLE